MSTSRNLRLLIALVVILAICEMIAALEPGNPGYRGSPQRRRNRHLQEPLDLDELDPEDPSNEVEERPPMTPEMVEHASTPKLVKGLNFAGEKGAKEFKELTEKLKARGDDPNYSTEEMMKRVHRHTKAMEKKRRERIAARKKAAQET